MSDERAKLRVVEESAISADLAARIARLLCVCFPNDAEFFSASRAWHGSTPLFSIIGENIDRVIAHVGVVDRTIAVGSAGSETVVRVAGVQNVAIAPEHRGQGWVDAAMKLAMEQAARRDFEAGLLFCGMRRIKTYERCGWRLIDEPEVIRVDDGREVRLPGGNYSMFFPLRRRDWPPGPIHLRGNDW